jgi:hypothetical protein
MVCRKELAGEFGASTKTPSSRSGAGTGTLESVNALNMAWQKYDGTLFLIAHVHI